MISILQTLQYILLHRCKLTEAVVPAGGSVAVEAVEPGPFLAVLCPARLEVLLYNCEKYVFITRLYEIDMWSVHYTRE